MVDGPDRALRNRAPGSHRNTARQAMDGLWTGAWAAKTVKRPRQQPAHPQYANYWAPLTRKQHTMPHSAQPQHTNYWAPRTRKQHQQEHRLQRPTESSGPTQHAKGRTGDCPGPCKGATTRRNVTQVGGGGGHYIHPCCTGVGNHCIGHNPQQNSMASIVMSVFRENLPLKALGKSQQHTKNKHLASVHARGPIDCLTNPASLSQLMDGLGPGEPTPPPSPPWPLRTRRVRGTRLGG